MRSIRDQVFCWQEKKILRLLRKKYQDSDTMLRKMKYLYFTITEIDNDFNGKQIKYYTKTIHTYSGLPVEWIPKGLKELEKMKIIIIKEEKDNGRFKGKWLKFTPNNIPDTVKVKTVNGKAVHGKPLNGKPVNGETIDGSTVNGKSNTSEQSNITEQSIEYNKEPRKVCNNTNFTGTIKNWCSKMESRYCPDKQFKQCMVWYNEYRKWLCEYLIEKKIVEASKVVNFCKSKTYFPIFENQMKNWMEHDNGMPARIKLFRANIKSMED